MMPVQIAGLVSVSNSNALTGGYDAETDEAYYERYLLRLQTPPTSGNQYHYRLWALEVTGVGGVQIYPLGHGDRALIDEPLFAQLGQKYGKSSAQIILRWHIQDGNIVIPGSKNPDHIRDNFDLFDFSLTQEEMAQIAAMDRQKRYYTSTTEMLRGYAEMVPPVDEQK